jgi:hypothetical protein
MNFLAEIRGQYYYLNSAAARGVLQLPFILISGDFNAKKISFYRSFYCGSLLPGVRTKV